MRFFLGVVLLASELLGQTGNSPSDPTRIIVGRLELDRYKAYIKGLAQFGDRMQGTQRNRDAIDWLEKQLRNFGYAAVERPIHPNDKVAPKSEFLRFGSS